MVFERVSKGVLHHSYLLSDLGLFVLNKKEFRSRVDTDKIRGKTFSMLSILSLAWTALLHTHVIPSLSAIAPCGESFPLRKVRILSFEGKALKCKNLALIDPQGLGKNGSVHPG